MTAPISDIPTPAPTRSCGSCTMCCKVYDVPPIDNKPRGVWCKHCKPGRGCGIWESRPQFCRDFLCTWILDPLLGDEWRPDRSKLVLNHLPTQNVLVVMVDPGTPDAWRKEPYHSALRRIAGTFAQSQQAVQVVVNHETTVLTPTGEFRIGSNSDEVEFKWAKRLTPAGEKYELVDVVVKTLRVA